MFEDKTFNSFYGLYLFPLLLDKFGVICDFTAAAIAPLLPTDPSVHRGNLANWDKRFRIYV